MSSKKNSADFNKEEKMNDVHINPTPGQEEFQRNQLIVQPPLTNGVSQQALQSEGATATWVRKPILDLAQQAQVAACTYLGVDPNETKYLNRIRQQGLVPDPFRPMEVHLHHHHHHYVDRFSKTETGSHILGVDVPASLGNSPSQSSPIVQPPKVPLYSHDSAALSRKSTLHIGCKDLSKYNVCSSKMDSICYPSESTEQMTLTYKPFCHSNRITQSAYSPGFWPRTISDPSEGNIPSQTYNSSTKFQRPCLITIPDSLTEDGKNENLCIPITSTTHGFTLFEQISIKEEKKSLMAEYDKDDDHVCWSSAKNEIRNGAPVSKTTEISSKENEKQEKFSHVAQKGAGAVLLTHFESQLSPSRKKSPVPSYLRSSVGALVPHDFSSSLEDICVASSETAGQVMSRVKPQAPSMLNTHYFSQGSQIDSPRMTRGGGWRSCIESNKVDKIGDQNVCTDGCYGALHNLRFLSSHEDSHVTSPETLKVAGELTYMENLRGSSVPNLDHSSHLSKCKQTDTQPLTGEQEEWRPFVKSYNVDKMCDQILRSDGFIVAVHAEESALSLDGSRVATFETAVPAGQMVCTENLHESPILNTPHSSPLSGRHIDTSMGAGEQGRGTHFGKSFPSGGKSNQILLTDGFHQKSIEAFSHVDSFENREGQCRATESKHETQQLMCGNKAQYAAEEKLYTSCASAKGVEDRLSNLMDERAFFHADFERKLDEGRGDNLQSHKVLEQGMSNKGSKEKRRISEKNIEDPVTRSKEWFCKDKLQESLLPISVGALQVNQCSSVKADEDAKSDDQDEAHLSENSMKAETIQAVPNNLYDDELSEFQQGSSPHSSFCNCLMSMGKQNLVVEKLMPNPGWWNDDTAQIKSMSVSGEDVVDKGIIVDKAMRAEGEVYGSQVNSLHSSLEKMVHGLDESEGLNMEMLHNDAASLQDAYFVGELQILRNAIQKLVTISHEQEIKLAELQNGKHLQSLQGKSYLIVLRDLYMNLLMDISKQIGNLNKDLKIDSFKIGDQEIQAVLKQRLEKSEAQVAALEKCLEHKNEHIEEINKKLQSVQNETDAALIEKFEFLHKIQAAQKENEDQKDRIKELVSINEDLLVFAEGKESELNSLKKEIEKIRKMIRVNVKENTNLVQELADTRKEMEELKDSEGFLKNRLKFLKSKLIESEYELSQCEEAIERLTNHLASATEGQDCLLKEHEQLHSSLKEAQYKEQQLHVQLRQSHRTIEELRDQLNSMGSEISKMNMDITDMKEQNAFIRKAVEGNEHKTLSMQEEASDVQCRVLQLEDEIMEKEGQITILKSSYHEDIEF